MADCTPGIILRLDKGSELTWLEVDNNWQSLYYSSSLFGNILEFYYVSSSCSHSIDLSNLSGLNGNSYYWYQGTYSAGATLIQQSATQIYFTGSGVTNMTSVANGVLIEVAETPGFPYSGSWDANILADESAQITGTLGITSSDADFGLSLSGSSFVVTDLPIQDTQYVVTFNPDGGTFGYIASTASTAGLSGTGGTAGQAGTAGSTGSSGTSGLSGTSGSTGSQGTSGSSGTSGTSASSATAGSSGSSGSSGSTGS